MTFAAAITFAFAIFIMTLTPGPGVLTITARAINSGPMAAIGTMIGITLADLIYFVLALLGMASLSQAMGSAFIIVKLAGGAYLIWLGIKMWRENPHDSLEKAGKTKRGFLNYFGEGLAVNMTNPKTIIFFAALLPTFIDLRALTLLDGVVFSIIIVVIGATTDLFYIMLASRARNLMKSPKAQKVLNRIGGTTLIGVGMAVASR